MSTTSDHGLPPGERAVVRMSLRVGAWLALPMVGLAGLHAGWSGALVAAGMLSLLAGGLAAVAWGVGRAARRGPGAAAAAAVGGSLLKLGVLVGLLASVPRSAIAIEVLAVATVLVAGGLLVAVSWAVTREPRAWVIEPGGPGHGPLPGGDDDRARA